MATNKHIIQLIQLTNSYFRLYLGISIGVFLFILFFQPFEANKFEFENKLLFLSGFGIIALLVLLLSQLLFYPAFINEEDEDHITFDYIPFYYFFQLAAASLAFVFYIRYVGQISITFNIVVKAVFICVSLPVTITIKFRLNSYQSRLKKLLLETKSLQDKLKQFSENYSNKHIEIISDNESDNLRIQVSEIVYVKSADNYVEVGYHDEGTVKKQMVRSTLRNVEHQLAEFNNFMRTHRTSIVNIQYIDKLNKNFNTYWLSLDKTKETLPVSRQYLMNIKDLL